MKPTLINHELRTIRLEYNSDQPLNDFETNAVLEYVKMHHKLLELIKRHNKLKDNLPKLKTDLNGLEQEINLLEEEIKKCGTIAGYTEEECEKMGITQGSIDVNIIIDKAMLHQQKMDVNFEETQQFRAAMKIWEADADKFSDAVDAYEENYSDRIIQNYKEMEIHSSSLHEDMQGFYKFYDDLYLDSKRKFTKDWNEYVLRFNAYLEKVKGIFSRVEKLEQTANNLIKKKMTGGFGEN